MPHPARGNQFRWIGPWTPTLVTNADGGAASAGFLARRGNTVASWLPQHANPVDWSKPRSRRYLRMGSWLCAVCAWMARHGRSGALRVHVKARG